MLKTWEGDYNNRNETEMKKKMKKDENIEITSLLWLLLVRTTLIAYCYRLVKYSSMLWSTLDIANIKLYKYRLNRSCWKIVKVTETEIQNLYFKLQEKSKFII